MKTAKRLLAICVVMAAMAFALAGCNGTTQGKANPEDAFIGTWYITALSEGETEVTPEDLAMMRTYGMEVTCEFKADKTMSLDLFGEVTDGTWTAKSATEGTITIEGQEANMTIEDGKLVFSEAASNTTMTFEKKTESSESASTSSDSASSSAESSASSESAATGMSAK